MASIVGRIPQDANRYPVLAGLSSSDGLTVTTLYVNPTTHALLTQGGSGSSSDQVQGTAAANAAAVGNPVRVGAQYDSTLPTYDNGDATNLQSGSRGSLNVTLMVADSTTPVNLAGTASDGVSTSATSSRLDTLAKNMVFNATTWDRQYSVINGFNSVGTGIAASGIVGQYDDTATGAVTENSFAPVRITSTRALMVDSVYSYGRATADTQIKGSAGFIHSITIAPTGTVTAGVLTVYDSTTETGTVIFSVALPVTTFTPFNIVLDVTAGTGIYVGFDASLANVQATVSYR